MTKMGTLYIVATPIGNLEDITLRALRILASVSLVAAEDTRRTQILLRTYDIKVPLVSLREHNEEGMSRRLIETLTAGADIAYVTDAGTPGLSDPGGRLIRNAVATGLRVVPIPGPTAAIAALSVSALPMDTFLFLGFLPSRSSSRRAFLATLAGERRTMVFYESPQRVLATLKDMESLWGERHVALARELTKVHEEVLRGSFREVIALLEERVMKGEITLVVGGAGEETPVTDEEILRALAAGERQGLSSRDRVAQTSEELAVPKRRVYDLELKRKQGDPFS